jgi:hypothetical protein
MKTKTFRGKKVYSDRWAKTTAQFEIGQNDLVKISNGAERFWVKLVKDEGNGWIAKVDNILVQPKPYTKGSFVRILDEHILERY